MPAKEKNEQLHKGHRERLRDRFLFGGLDDFTDIQVLELLLFYGIKQRDTNEIAHKLLNKFGSLSGVLDARVEDLMEFSYVKENAAALLKLIPQISRRYLVDRASHSTMLRTIEECGNYLLAQFVGRRNETVFLLCLDAACKVICCWEVGEGGINSANISTRRIVETALSAKASSVILAHNHPSGIALPSGEDIQTTRKVAAALDSVDIILTDHLIIADDDFVSLAQSGLYCYEDCRLAT